MTKSAYTVKLRRLMFITGLYFDCYKSKTLRRLHQLLTLFIVVFCWYTTLFILYHMVVNHKIAARYASYMIVFMWQIQSCIAMLFFIHWQYNGSINQMRILLEKTTKHGIRAVRKMVLTSILMVISCVCLTFGVTVMIKITGRESTFFNIQTVNPFFIPSLAPLNLIGGTYMLGISIMIISALSTQVLHIHADLKQLNKSLALIGHNTQVVDQEFLIHEIRSHMKHHSVIAQKIRIVSGIFEKYAFLCFATNIPLFVFTLFTLIVRMNFALIDAVLTIPEVVLGFMKIVFLLYIPSKIQTEASNSYTILCSNTKLWSKLDRNLYELTNNFLLHTNQPDLGIWIWCMAVISKPFILTGSSVVITSLTFLVQFHVRCKAPSDSTELMSVNFNVTAEI